MSPSDRALSVALLLLALALAPCPAIGAKLAVSPALATPRIGDLVSVTVQADEVEGLAGFQVRAGFDPAILEVVSVAVGNGFDRQVKKSYANATGQVSLAAMAIAAPPLGGSGLPLATIDFRVKGVGTSDIILSRALLGDSAGEEIPVTVSNGKISGASPTITITSPVAGFVTTATPLLDYTASGGAVTVKIDGSPVAVASGQLLPHLSEGEHTVSVEGGVGGVTWGASVTFTVDTVRPDVTITARPAGLVNVASGSFSFVSADQAATFECRLDAGTFTPCTSPSPFVLAEGSHSFEVRARDAAGNLTPVPAQYGWVIDLTPPSVVATTPAAGEIGALARNPVRAVFSEGINPATLTPATFFLAGVSGSVTYDPANRTGLFTPAAPLADATGYTALITAGVSDPAGNFLGGAFSWNFTTAASPLPVKMVLPVEGLYASLLELLKGGVSGNATIRAQTCTLEGDHLLNQNAALTIEGGYDGSFGTRTGYTAIHGVLGVVRGSLTAERLIVK